MHFKVYILEATSNQELKEKNEKQKIEKNRRKINN